ncbi:acyl-CoA thioesterase [Puia dinghuensis]|uniref:Thioesterase n=1 Tax=Puia dinghuensis TaxID=1792502 RepID=A0A8J2UBF6_9BACT|nr:acyl-CoA thioesterase [Puia dinghuensis]GGA93811.1 thioesterase [Puia dinghuensis]
MEKTPMSFYTVRFNDCDPMGHLNNSKYIDYFLNAREDHLKEHYGIDLKEWAQRGDLFVVSQHEIRYLRPVTYNERVGIQSALIGWGDSFLMVEMLMFDEARQLKTILWTRFTRINARTGKKEAHPAEFMEWIQGTLVEGIELERGLNGRLEGLRMVLPG